MIKLACNYYPETEELVKDKLIDIDYFKFPALGFQMGILYDFPGFERFVQKVKQAKPLLLHGLVPSPHNICSPNFKTELQVDVVQKLINISGTPGISIYLDGADEYISKDKLIETVTGNIQYLKEVFTGLEFIALENVDKCKSRYVVDPEVINKIIQESGINFLLDISHAFYAANQRKEDFMEYLQRLPLDKVYEIHINGWAERNGDIIAHVKINDLGYTALKAILEICSPKIVTLEYGRHNDRIGSGCPVMKPDSINEEAKQEIIEQVDKLREIIVLYS